VATINEYDEALSLRPPVVEMPDAVERLRQIRLEHLKRSA
jgi:hypothetical protein